MLVLRPLLQKAPKNLRCVLWGLVELRLALPVRLKSALSLVPSARPVPPEITTERILRAMDHSVENILARFQLN